MDNWQDMTQAALDDAYANASHIPDGDAYPDRWAHDAAGFRATARHQTLDYGSGPADRLDLFHPPGPPEGLIVFIHGGYWRRFARSDWSHFAEGGLAAGHAVAMPGYPLVPSVRISDITRRMAQAVDTAAHRIPGPIRLTGHSAGGHLAARLVMADAAPDCADRIAACVPISPLTDLRPLIPQSHNADWRLDEAEAQAESPALGQPIPGPNVAVHVGADERPSFLWQARALSDAWSVLLRIAPGKHHFDVIDALRDPSSPLMADILA
ncbi:MAG: alpha/beta hydrolase [Pseudomonadota bacterium]